MSRYDLDGDGMLNYEEFMGFLLPFDPKYRDLCLARSKFCTAQSYARLEFFLRETNELLKTVLQSILSVEMRVERVR